MFHWGIVAWIYYLALNGSYIQLPVQRHVYEKGNVRMLLRIWNFVPYINFVVLMQLKVKELPESCDTEASKRKQAFLQRRTERMWELLEREATVVA